MSTCISRAGEYSAHETTEGNYICDRCGVLDEEGIFAEAERLRMAGRLLAERAEHAEATLDRVRALLKVRGSLDADTMLDRALAILDKYLADRR